MGEDGGGFKGERIEPVDCVVKSGDGAESDDSVIAVQSKLVIRGGWPEIS